jgi:hypothetical protein
MPKENNRPVGENSPNLVTQLDQKLVDNSKKIFKKYKTFSKLERFL